MGITMSRYEEGLFPHPYLAHVHNKRYGGTVNNIGLIYPRDMPFERDPAYFTILVTGGSVAEQFAGLANPQYYLENILNAQYDFHGKTVRIVSGAMGGWKQPLQTIFLSMYAQAIDAVISIEGFNEHYPLLPTAWASMDIPTPNYKAVNPALSSGNNRLEARAVASLSDRVAKELSFSRTLFFINKGITGALIQKIAKAETLGEKQLFGNTTEDFFTLPSDWSAEEKIEYNLELYRKYIRIMDTVSRELELRRAFFIQPCPAIDKPLTEAEKEVVGDLGYGDTYRRMTNVLLNLASERNIPVISLLDIFAGVTDDIYADSIHCYVRRGDEESTGYRMMAERIAVELEKAWHLEKK
jgi:hypothetical protein